MDGFSILATRKLVDCENKDIINLRRIMRLASFLLALLHRCLVPIHTWAGAALTGNKCCGIIIWYGYTRKGSSP